MSKIQDRINQFIAHIGSNPSEFSLNIGKSRGFVRAIKEEIGSGVLHNIVRIYPELNLYWLVTGEGEMIISNKNESTNDQDLLNRLEKKSEEIGRLKSEIEILKSRLNTDSSSTKAS